MLQMQPQCDRPDEETGNKFDNDDWETGHEQLLQGEFHPDGVVEGCVFSLSIFFISVTAAMSACTTNLPFHVKPCTMIPTKALHRGDLAVAADVDL